MDEQKLYQLNIFSISNTLSHVQFELEVVGNARKRQTDVYKRDYGLGVAAQTPNT